MFFYSDSLHSALLKLSLFKFTIFSCNLIVYNVFCFPILVISPNHNFYRSSDIKIKRQEWFPEQPIHYNSIPISKFYIQTKRITYYIIQIKILLFAQISKHYIKLNIVSVLNIKYWELSNSFSSFLNRLYLFYFVFIYF